MYYLFDRSWAMSPARASDRSSYDRQGVWWNTGQPFSQPIKTPIQIKLKPLLVGAPDQGPAMPAMFKGPIPIYRDDLVDALRNGGGDNLEVFPAQVVDPDSGQIHHNYQAVNVIGLLAAADMQKSGWSAPDGIPLVDVAFDSLTVDPMKARGLLLFRLAENFNALIVHERLRDHLLSAGFSELDFHVPEQAAL